MAKYNDYIVNTIAPMCNKGAGLYLKNNAGPANQNATLTFYIL